MPEVALVRTPAPADPFPPYRVRLVAIPRLVLVVGPKSRTGCGKRACGQRPRPSPVCSSIGRVTAQRLLTWREARAIASTDAISGRVLRGSWQSPLPGVYAPDDRPLSVEDWALAAVLATGGRPSRSGARAVAAGRTAARVWGLPLIDDDDPATQAHEAHIHEVIANRGLRTLTRSGQSVEVRRRQVTLAPHEAVFLEAGFWITTPLRTVVDCAAVLAPDATVCLIDAALHNRLVSASELAALVEQRHGLPGGRRLAVAVAVADAQAESPAESLARLLVRPVLPGLLPQVRIWDRDRLLARVDFGDEEIKLALEVDGRAGHAGEHMVAKDRARDRRLEGLGWWTERCTWYELRCQREELVARLVARDALLRTRAA